MADIQPEIKEFFDLIIADSFGFTDMLKTHTVSRDWIYEKLWGELLAKQAEFLQNNLTPKQLKEYQKLLKKSEQQAVYYVVNNIPKYSEKVDQFNDTFYEYYVLHPRKK